MKILVFYHAHLHVYNDPVRYALHWLKIHTHIPGNGVGYFASCELLVTNFKVYLSN